MADGGAFRDFTCRLKLLISKHPELITTTLSNIFTMRLIGNKTHGDLAEIGIAEFINQYMYDYRSAHVGKELFRAKSTEEDIKIINEITSDEILVSLKAYGIGPLQLSTDKDARMFPRLSSSGKEVIRGNTRILEILEGPEFQDFQEMNILPLIYDENERKCNILVFNIERAKERANTIRRVQPGGQRIHPVFQFLDEDEEYICEVRYGDATANALQRGLWTHTKRAARYFDSITSGWIDYAHNQILVQLFSHALVSSQRGHTEALDAVKSDIKAIREGTLP